MQAIRVAQKSDPDLLIDDGDAATPAESTVTTISSRPPVELESAVIARSELPDPPTTPATPAALAQDDTEPTNNKIENQSESLGSLRVNLAPFVPATTPSENGESASSIRINTPTFSSPPIAPVVLIEDTSSAFVKVSRSDAPPNAEITERREATAITLSRRPLLMVGAIALLLMIAGVALFLAVR